MRVIGGASHDAGSSRWDGLGIGWHGKGTEVSLTGIGVF